jgi:hypothetical protein
VTAGALTESKSTLHVSEPIRNGIKSSIGTADQLFTRTPRIQHIAKTFPKNTFCAEQWHSSCWRPTQYQETFLDNVYLAVSPGDGDRTVRVWLASHSFAGRYHGQDSRD